MANAYGEGIPIPNVIDPPESFAVTLCIPKNTMHVAAFFGALYQLTTWTSWERNGTDDGKRVADVWWRYYQAWNTQITDLECEDGNMDCCTEPAIIKRVNPTTGQVEQSTDNGATWKPVAGGLQSYIVNPVPPVSSGVAGTKCDAATNLAGQVDVWINQVTTDFDTATSLLEFGIAVLEAILLAVVTILSAGTLTAVEALVLPTIGAALFAAWGAGKAVFVAYWTTDIKDKILCAAYCNIGDDGSFTDAQFSAFWNKVNMDLPPSPAKMLFMGFISSVGTSGVNAMAATGMSADADCSDCDCETTCNADNWNLVNYNGSPVGTLVTRDDNSITLTGIGHPDFGTPYNAMIQTGGDDICCVVFSITLVSGTMPLFFGVDCGNPRWPSSPNGPFTVMVSNVNTLFLRGDSAPFTVKVTFD
jgi:hypothetical protein